MNSGRTLNNEGLGPKLEKESSQHPGSKNPGRVTQAKANPGVGRPCETVAAPERTRKEGRREEGRKEGGKNTKEKN